MHVTISMRDGFLVQQFFERIQIDNDGIIERKLAPKIRKLLPEVRKQFRLHQLPSGLNDQELKYMERVEWPRSIYRFEKLREASLEYRDVHDDILWTKDMIDQFNHPYLPSTRFSYDASLARNKSSMKKGAGLPSLGKKRDNLSEAIQYVEEVIKPARSLDKMYSILPGVRTQQSQIEDPKVRLVWMVPISTWYMECEALDDALSVTQDKTQNLDEIFVFYTPPEMMAKWVSKYYSSVTQWVNLDAEQFDSTVAASEIRQMASIFFGNYEFSEILEEYLVNASLVMPEGDLTRNGGQPSGSKTTNLFDGYCNVGDVIASFHRFNLDRFIECILVNGDDITVGLSTKLTSDNLEKIAHYSLRNIHPEKSVMGDYVWNSKWFVDGEIITRPVFRVLNSLMYSERQKLAIFGSKEYVELATSQQLKDIENHPIGDFVIKEVAKVTKYHISTMTDEQLMPAAEAYQDAHSYQEWMTPERIIDQARSSRYAQGGS